MSSAIGWVKSLTILALGRLPKPSAEELKAMATWLAKETPTIKDAVIERAVTELIRHQADTFMPSPAMILEAVRREIQPPLNVEHLLRMVRLAYLKDASFHLSRRTVDQLLLGPLEQVALTSLIDTLGAERLVSHALGHLLHPATWHIALKAAQQAVSKLPVDEGAVRRLEKHNGQDFEALAAAVGPRAPREGLLASAKDADTVVHPSRERP